MICNILESLRLTILLLARSTALGSALLAGSAIGLFGWDIRKPETMAEVNTKGSTEFKPSIGEPMREKRWQRWQCAVQRAMKWEESEGDLS
jgi:glycerol kinase